MKGLAHCFCDGAKLAKMDLTHEAHKKMLTRPRCFLPPGSSRERSWISMITYLTSDLVYLPIKQRFILRDILFTEISRKILPINCYVTQYFLCYCTISEDFYQEIIIRPGADPWVCLYKNAIARSSIQRRITMLRISKPWKPRSRVKNLLLIEN